MIKRAIEITILVLLTAFLGHFVWNNTMLCSPYYFKKGKVLYNSGHYDSSVKFFERSLKVNPENAASRYFLTLALSKGTPTYSHQEALYKMANSKNHDMAQNYAKAQLIGLKERLTEGIEDNYIYSAILNKDILRWNIESFPIKVYFEKTTNSYRDNIKKAFEQWGKASGFLQFKEVYNQEESDIEVKFIPYNGPRCQSATCNYVIATTTSTTDKYHRLKQMVITFYKTNPFGESFSDAEIYNTALHEIGHALGISGHSDNPNDVMYASHHKVSAVFEPYSKDIFYLSRRDLNTLALLYRLAPSITNSKGWFYENLYYPPLILGNDEEILKKKLEEYQQYINKYPNYCGGYINIATVYSSMGNNKKAQNALDKAFEFATNDNEKYLIHYNRAVMYFNNQDFNAALNCAKDAQAIKNDETTNALIQDIEQMLKTN